MSLPVYFLQCHDVKFFYISRNVVYVWNAHRDDVFDGAVIDIGEQHEVVEQQQKKCGKISSCIAYNCVKKEWSYCITNGQRECIDEMVAFLNM
jgi:hypothetical protein